MEWNRRRKRRRRRMVNRMDKVRRRKRRMRRRIRSLTMNESTCMNEWIGKINTISLNNHSFKISSESGDK
jgi:hypothetical protein